MRALSNQGKTIRIPVYMYDVIAKWRRVRDGLMQKLNRVPTRKEIAKIMEVPVQKVKEIENIAGRPSSLNAPVSLDGTAELIDLIQDDTSHMPDVQIGEVLKNERVQRILDRLDERERRILILRFGLGNEEPHTLEEVAQEFTITRERVRQIEAASLKKIRELLLQEQDSLQNYISE
jgi:RNA polymerase primary sigma factor